ncbi:hypothetical protein AGRA3207_003664 [Actinomadura graeca]|uniref:Uncharacterized protein n=1 Tax=Actinomadura graeca TaxID=2750812 RepID=A0ABX8QWC3_9ACTN|nr:hypothetical protein [Actinomadura graeca]QXJ22631.1 hypothetical protein AGRA3207_003664 [Actinomadura graeca]
MSIPASISSSVIGAVDDRVRREMVEQGLFDLRVVVPVVESARAREEVEVFAAGFVVHSACQGPAEHRRPFPAIAADFRFQWGEDIYGVDDSSTFVSGPAPDGSFLRPTSAERRSDW